MTFADNVLSDLPFFFFALLALVCMERSPKVLNQVGLGVAIFFSYFIRDMGIVLLGTLMVYQLMCWTGDRKTRAWQWILGIPYVVFVALLGAVKVGLPDGGENHMRKLKEHFSGEVILKNVQDYSTLFEDYFFINESVWFVLLTLVVVGMISGWRTHAHFIVFVLGCLSIILIWPHYQGVRFVFPVVPFIVYFMVSGLWFFLEKIPWPTMVRSVIPVLLATYVIVRSIIDVQSYHEKDSNQAWTEETREWYAYLSAHVNSDEVVAFEKPRVLRFFTGITSIHSTPEHFA